MQTGVIACADVLDAARAVDRKVAIWLQHRDVAAATRGQEATDWQPVAGAHDLFAAHVLRWAEGDVVGLEASRAALGDVVLLQGRYVHDDTRRTAVAAALGDDHVGVIANGVVEAVVVVRVKISQARVKEQALVREAQIGWIAIKARALAARGNPMTHIAGIVVVVGLAQLGIAHLERGN